MKRLFLFILCAALAACTGTQEVGVPRLIVIASSASSSADAEGKLTLTQDVFFSDGLNPQRFQFLKDLVLPAKPIAYDIVNRKNTRDTLVILSKNATETFLSFVNLAGINPASPTEFELSSPTITVNTLPGVETDFEFAATKVQIDQTGRYVAIMNSFNDPTKQDAIDLIDLQATDGAELLTRLSDSVIGSDFYLLQANNPRLFYFTLQAGGAELTSLTLSNQSISKSNLFLPNSRSNLPLDLSLINNQLIALQKESFTPIDNFTGTASLGTTVVTSTESKHLVATNSLSLAVVLILGSNKLTAHRSSADTEIKETSFSAVNGSIEPLGLFAYFVSEGNQPIKLFDVQTFERNLDSSVSSLIQSYSLFNTDGEAINVSAPAFITWAISKPIGVSP